MPMWCAKLHHYLGQVRSDPVRHETFFRVDSYGSPCRAASHGYTIFVIGWSVLPGGANTGRQVRRQDKFNVISMRCPAREMMGFV
jgi:hypothetical protein